RQPRVSGSASNISAPEERQSRPPLRGSGSPAGALSRGCRPGLPTTAPPGLRTRLPPQRDAPRCLILPTIVRANRRHHPARVWEEVRAMARRKRGEFLIDLRPVIEKMGLREVIDQIGLDRVIEQAGVDQVLKQIDKKKRARSLTLDDFLASLSPAE